MAWREKKLTLNEAAAACAMPVGTFYSKARRFETVDSAKSTHNL